MSMNLKKRFDQLILENLEKNGCGPFGYTMDPKTYPVYYSKEAFEAFRQEMQTQYPQYYQQYSKGKGSELLETSTPPKMASVASSSRFAYIALRNGAEGLGGTKQVTFEYACKIKDIGGPGAQLDAYTTDEQGNPIYVEVKCHEIFDFHKILLKPPYWNKFYGESNSFGFPVNPNIPKDSFELSLEAFGISQKDTSLVDMKQLLCHLLGIASQNPDNRPGTLVYLFFKPKVTGHDRDLLEKVFTQLMNEFSAILQSAPIKTFCGIHNIGIKVLAEEAEVMEPLTKENIAQTKVELVP